MSITTNGAARVRPLPLDRARIARGRLGRPGLFGVVAAMSADHLWIFKGDPGRWTPSGDFYAWTGEYLPTGDTVAGSTLAAVRTSAAHPGVVDEFRKRAVDELAELAEVAGRGGRLARAVIAERVSRDGEPGRRALRWALARRRLDVLDGALVVDEVTGVCACGGFLAGAVHADACPDCVGERPGRRIRCARLDQHQACGVVVAVMCAAGCGRAAGAVVCRDGVGFCRGRCEPC